MTKYSLLAVGMMILLAGPIAAQQLSTSTGDPQIKAVVKVADQIKLPSREPGVLVHLAVKEGSQVTAGQPIGKIDDSEAVIQKQAADYGLKSAVKAAKSDIHARYSKAEADVAQADYEIMVEANKMADKAITATDIRRAKLAWDQALLGIEKAKHDQAVALLDAYTKKAEYDAADLKIQRRIITAPFDGVVEQINRKQDEWVQPGDPILTLFRMDTMEVEGAVDKKLYDPNEIQGCEVTVEVKMARDRIETVRGRITKVSSTVRGDRVFNVRAEVANRQDRGTWMLRDGMESMMTIHLGTGGAAAAEVTRAP